MTPKLVGRHWFVGRLFPCGALPARWPYLAMNRDAANLEVHATGGGSNYLRLLARVLADRPAEIRRRATPKSSRPHPTAASAKIEEPL
jgi:hypothetical protein